MVSGWAGGGLVRLKLKNHQLKQMVSLRTGPGC